MLDWNKFKSGEVKVVLKTKELAEEFYKECKKNGIDWCGCDYAIWREGGIVYGYSTLTNTLSWGELKEDSRIKVEWKGIDKMINSKMEKTFSEVITTIKEREIWICKEFNRKIIKGDDGVVEIRRLDDTTFGNISGILFMDEIYTLQRKQYTFNEVHNAFKEGEEIENCTTGVKLILEGNIIKYKYPNMATWEMIDKEHNIFSTEDILNHMWYINDAYKSVKINK